jgi:hypothetical protein
MKLKIKNNPRLPEQFRGKILNPSSEPLMIIKLNEGESSVYPPSEHKYFVKTDSMWFFPRESDVEEVLEP